MADHAVGSVLASTLDSVFQRAAAELSEALGGPVTARVRAGKLLSGNDLQRVCEAPGLVVAGSLGGGVEGSVAFVLRREHAVLLAREAEQAGVEAPDGEQMALSEGDVAAVVFALARIGAAATAVWKGELGHEVLWPSEPTDLSAQPTEAGEGGAAVQEAVGGSGVAGWTVEFGEPVGIELLIVLPASTAQTMAALLDPEAEWVKPAADVEPSSGLARLLPVELPVRVVVARRTVTVRELLQLVPGRVLDLEKRCDRPLELYAGAKLVARGDAMVVDERFGFRVGELVPDGATDRPRRLVR